MPCAHTVEGHTAQLFVVVVVVVVVCPSVMLFLRGHCWTGHARVNRCIPASRCTGVQCKAESKGGHAHMCGPLTACSCARDKAALTCDDMKQPVWRVAFTDRGKYEPGKALALFFFLLWNCVSCTPTGHRPRRSGISCCRRHYGRYSCCARLVRQAPGPSLADIQLPNTQAVAVQSDTPAPEWWSR